jgi:hypothetical protein
MYSLSFFLSSGGCGLAKPIFISYARSTNAVAANTLFEALGGAEGDAFLDRTDIALGEHFPRALIEAIWDARIFVAFIDDVYLTRWVCLRELRTALAPLDALSSQSTTAVPEKDPLLRHIVLAIPNSGSSNLLENLPAELRNANWPTSSQIADLVELLHHRLRSVSLPIRAHLDVRESLGVRELFLAETALPPPRRISCPRFPSNFPPSLNDRFVGRTDDLFRGFDAIFVPAFAPSSTQVSASSLPQLAATIVCLCSAIARPIARQAF